jgi:putative transposase
MQQKLMKLSIKFIANKPGYPHLNGKIERSQKTDGEEFYLITDLSDFKKLREVLSIW